MVYQMSLWAEDLGEYPSGRWARPTRKVLTAATREFNWEVLTVLGMSKIDHKLTPATTAQEECEHVQVRMRASQWYRSVECRRCHWRLRYMPTLLAVASAQARRQRRRVRLQQAGRLARTTHVARELTAARIRELAVRETHEAAHAEAAQEMSAA